MFINIPIFAATFVRTFDDERAPRSNAKLVELQFRSFVEPFVASFSHARTSALESVKARSRFNLDRGDEPLKPSARPIVARNIVVAQMERPVIGPTRYLEGLTSAFHRNFYQPRRRI